MTWDTIIGLEVHAQLNTASKLFSGAPTLFGTPANSQTCYIDAGLPGTLPVLNQQVIIMAIQFGLAINAHINDLSYFERKNYFYPDLPKGYQISQFQRPIVRNGWLMINNHTNSPKKIIIERAHLEEDAGKSLHDKHSDYTGIDLNRAGTPLLEIVTTPCLHSGEEVVAYLKCLHQLLRFLGICDGNMQEGSFRCDVNISLKPHGSTILGTRTELKNLNSFRFIEKAIAYEQARQQDLLEAGLMVKQETRLFCPDTQTTQVLRSKENAHDYRYFPDPDLLPIAIHAIDIANIKQSMPQLPQAIYDQLSHYQDITEEDKQFLLTSPAHWQFFDNVSQQTDIDKKILINWLKGHVTAALHEQHQTFANTDLSSTRFAELMTYLHQKTISTTIARQIFTLFWQNQDSVADIIAREGFVSADNPEALIKLIEDLINDYPKQAEEYRQGKEKLFAFFVGQMMKATKGQANPAVINVLLKEALNILPR